MVEEGLCWEVTSELKPEGLGEARPGKNGREGAAYAKTEVGENLAHSRSQKQTVRGQGQGQPGESLHKLIKEGTNGPAK